MTLKQLTDNWKCIGVIVATAVALCGTAVGFDQRYAKSVDLKQLQLSSNYNNFQMRLDSLRTPYVTYKSDGTAFIDYAKMPRETVQQIKWLEKQIKILEKQMGISDEDG